MSDACKSRDAIHASGSDASQGHGRSSRRRLPIGPGTDAAPRTAGVASNSRVTADAGPTRDLADDDLHELLVAFYETVEKDELLAPYFAPVDMREHMPRIVDFWSTILFQTGRYTGNAFRPHAAMPGLTGEHIAHWLAVLDATIDARFAGPAAEYMKDMGHRIAYSMQLRLGIPPFEPFRATTEA